MFFRNCGNQINVPHCQLATHCYRCHFCFGCSKVQEQRFPNYLFSFIYLIPWFRSCLLWVWTQHSIADTQVKFLNSGDNGRFTHITQTCKGLFSSNMFFWLRAVRTASESTEKYVQNTEMAVRFGPVRTKTTFSKKRTFFFTSVRPSVKTVSAADTRRSGRLGVLKPRVYFRISVAMCKYFPLQLIIKNKRRFYIWIRIVDPKLFSPMKF